MNTPNTRELETAGLPDRPERDAAAAMIATGAVAGAGIGFFAGAGLIGAIVGALLGGAAALLVGEMVRRRSERERATDALLDREIGVSGGDIGSLPPDAVPPPIGGAYSAASAGASLVGNALPASGPIPR